MIALHPTRWRWKHDWPANGGNSNVAFRSATVVIRKGKTPSVSGIDARLLLDAIDTSTLAGLRDRALIALMVHTIARIGAALKMRLDDVRLHKRQIFTTA